MAVHTLKTWREPFRATWEGRKPFEVRVDDRGIQLGDYLHLVEWDAAGATGYRMLGPVTYVVRSEAPSPLPPGVAVFGVEVENRLRPQDPRLGHEPSLPRREVRIAPDHDIGENVDVGP